MAKIPKDLKINTIIYTLEDPDTGEIRYIGKTVKPLKSRLTGHIYTARKVNNHRCNWIKSIIKRGKKPVIKFLDACNWDESQSLETYWIFQFKSWGYSLVNATDGGEGNLGLKLSKERKYKLILSVSKIVYQYSLKGIFIKEYSSVAEAAKDIGYKSSKISLAARGLRGKAAEFLWSYEKFTTLPSYERKKKNISKEQKIIISEVRSIPIEQLNLKKEHIEFWESAKIAAISLGYSYTNIIGAISKQKSYKNYLWKKRK